MVPSTYGRSGRGVNDTAAIQLHDTTAATATIATAQPTRRVSPSEPTRTYRTNSTGTTSQASTILAWKASPTHSPATSRRRGRPRCTAVTAASAASTSSSTSSVSATLPRSSVTVAGAVANTAAATMPATAPAQRRTALKSTRTLRAPSITCGSATAHVWAPKARTDSACTQKAPGSLSSEIVPAGSKAAKKKSCQLDDILRSAAA